MAENNEVTRHIFIIRDSDVEVEYEVEEGIEQCSLIIRDKETAPPTEIFFPTELLSSLIAWVKDKGGDVGEAPPKGIDKE